MSPQSLEKCTKCFDERGIFCKLAEARKIPFTKTILKPEGRTLFQYGHKRGRLNSSIDSCAANTGKVTVTEYWPKTTEMMPYVAASHYGQRVWIALNVLRMSRGIITNPNVLKKAIMPDESEKFRS